MHARMSNPEPGPLAASLRAAIDRDPERPTANVNRATLRAVLDAFDSALLAIDPGRDETVEVVARAIADADAKRFVDADEVECLRHARAALTALQALVAGEVEG